MNQGRSQMSPSKKQLGFGNFAMLTAVSCVLLAVFATPLRAGKVTPIPVTGCGLLKQSFGVYLVANDISTSGTGICLTITGTSVSLNFQGHKLTGSGKGTGVRTGNTGPVIENGTISGFTTGISASGSNKLVITNMQVNSNTDGLVATSSNNIVVNESSFDGNLNTGASLLSCSGGNLGGDDFSGNSTGLYFFLSNGLNVMVSGIGTGGGGPNLKAGVYLNRSDSNTFMGNGISSSQGYGVWVVRSANNRFEQDGASGYFAGIFVGCSSTGPGGGACSPAGSFNNTFVQTSGDATNGPGIAIDQGNTSNRVIDCITSGSMFDGNANCDNNTWSLNSFSSANQPCIN
jgi:parallel beta-helix repeat protein